MTPTRMTPTRDPYEAKTRELPRPARPSVPKGWSYQPGLEAWIYQGRLADAVLEEPGPDDLEPDIERVEAELELLRYLRADRAHQSFGAARDGVCPAPQAVPNPPEESLEWAAWVPPCDGRAPSSLCEVESAG